jgi:energy-coupling factor transporter ATP-binding protein EcfA2
VTDTATADGITPSFLSRGSIWRKWDLHVHSPLSGLNNQFRQLPNHGGPDWESYIQTLEALQDIAVLGITDYFSIAGYRQLMQYRQNGRLQNIALVLPNVELRLDTFVVERRAREINFHVIFSDAVAPEDIEKEFLEALDIQVAGSISGLEGERKLNERSLLQLGQAIKENNLAFRANGYLEAALKNITVSFKQVQELLRKGIFDSKFLLVLSGSEWGDIDWNQAYLTKKNFLQAAHVLETGSPATIAWALGKGDLSKEEFLKEFGALKPCIHGSDAHRLEKIAKPDGDRYCWIKADPTFEGLKQIVYEPEDRVFIGEEPAKLKNDYQVIQSISVRNAPDWFDPVGIPLNDDLVSIIGGRGSGKSALVEVIALAGGSERFKQSEYMKDSFLAKASKRTPGNPNPIVGAKVELTWQSGEAETVDVPSSLGQPLTEEKVKYLPQKFVERLCDPEYPAEIQREMERVIFQRLDVKDRQGASSLQGLRQIITQKLSLKTQKLRQSIQALNQRIAEAGIRIAAQLQKQDALDRKRVDLDKLDQGKPELPLGSREDIEALDRLTALRQKVEHQISSRHELISKLDAIATRVDLFEEDIASYNAEIRLRLEAIGLAKDAQAFQVRIPDEGKQILAARRTTLQSEIRILEEGTEDETTPSLASLDKQIAGVRGRLQLSDSKRAAFDRYGAERQALSTLIISLEEEVHEIEQVVRPRLAAEVDERLERYLDVFDVLQEERVTLESLYTPLRAALQRGGDVDKRLTFVSRINADLSQHTQRGLSELLDRSRRGRYREEVALGDRLKGFFRGIEENEFSRDAIKAGLSDFYQSFLSDSDGNPLRIADQMRKGKTERDFDEWFFSTEVFSVSYSIKFDNKDLELLSPGQKGIVLLLLYLEIEQEDNRPLIIDQPEENLDNISIYDNLIEYFRKRKKSRQIIMITHNPNLVVNTDSEQVIVADFDGTRRPRIRYRSGALENTVMPDGSSGIRQDVCRTLEGGTEAFRRREQKYSLPPM